MILSRNKLLSLAFLLALSVLANKLLFPISTSNLSALSASPARIVSSGFNAWIAQGIWISKIENQTTLNPESIVLNLSNVLSLEPGNRFYRTNAAGILAYDLAALDLQPKIRQQYLATSIQLLKEGISRFPEDAAFYHYELGKIYLLKKQDPDQARAHFQIASEKAAGR